MAHNIDSRKIIAFVDGVENETAYTLSTSYSSAVVFSGTAEDNDLTDIWKNGYLYTYIAGVDEEHSTAELANSFIHLGVSDKHHLELSNIWITQDRVSLRPSKTDPSYNSFSLGAGVSFETEEDVTCDWSVSDPTRLSVEAEEDGKHAKFTATQTMLNEIGNSGYSRTITITASINVGEENYVKTCIVSVKYIQPTKLLIHTQNVKLNSGKILRNIEYDVYPKTANYETPVWQTANSSVCEITNGNIKGVTAGQYTTITGRIPNGVSDSFVTYVTNAVCCNNIQIVGDTTQINANCGHYKIFQAVVYPTNATDKNVTWHCSHPKMCTVTNENDNFVSVFSYVQGDITLYAEHTEPFMETAYASRTIKVDGSATSLVTSLTGYTIKRNGVRLNTTYEFIEGDDIDVNFNYTPSNASLWTNVRVYSSTDTDQADNGVVTFTSSKKVANGTLRYEGYITDVNEHNETNKLNYRVEGVQQQSIDLPVYQTYIGMFNYEYNKPVYTGDTIRVDYKVEPQGFLQQETQARYILTSLVGESGTVISQDITATYDEETETLYALLSVPSDIPMTDTYYIQAEYRYNGNTHGIVDIKRYPTPINLVVGDLTLKDTLSAAEGSLIDKRWFNTISDDEIVFSNLADNLFMYITGNTFGIQTSYLGDIEYSSSTVDAMCENHNYAVMTEIPVSVHQLKLKFTNEPNDDVVVDYGSNSVNVRIDTTKETFENGTVTIHGVLYYGDNKTDYLPYPRITWSVSNPVANDWLSINGNDLIVDINKYGNPEYVASDWKRTITAKYSVGNKRVKNISFNVTPQTEFINTVSFSDSNYYVMYNVPDTAEYSSVKEITITADINDDVEAANRVLAWTYNNPSWITITDDGMLYQKIKATGIKYGIVAVTASTPDGYYAVDPVSATCQLHVVKGMRDIPLIVNGTLVTGNSFSIGSGYETITLDFTQCVTSSKNGCLYEYNYGFTFRAGTHTVTEENGNGMFTFPFEYIDGESMSMDATVKLIYNGAVLQTMSKHWTVNYVIAADSLYLKQNTIFCNTETNEFYKHTLRRSDLSYEPSTASINRNDIVLEYSNDAANYVTIGDDMSITAIANGQFTYTATLDGAHNAGKDITNSGSIYVKTFADTVTIEENGVFVPNKSQTFASQQVKLYPKYTAACGQEVTLNPQIQYNVVNRIDGDIMSITATSEDSVGTVKNDTTEWGTFSLRLTYNEFGDECPKQHNYGAQPYVTYTGYTGFVEVNAPDVCIRNFKQPISAIMHPELFTSYSVSWEFGIINAENGTISEAADEAVRNAITNHQIKFSETGQFDYLDLQSAPSSVINKVVPILAKTQILNSSEDVVNVLYSQKFVTVGSHQLFNPLTLYFSFDYTNGYMRNEGEYSDTAIIHGHYNGSSSFYLKLYFSMYLNRLGMTINPNKTKIEVTPCDSMGNPLGSYDMTIDPQQAVNDGEPMDEYAQEHAAFMSSDEAETVYTQKVMVFFPNSFETEELEVSKPVTKNYASCEVYPYMPNGADVESKFVVFKMEL